MPPTSNCHCGGRDFLEIDKDRIAVALRYDRDREQVPHVTAKGRGQIAAQIIDLAQERGIPVHEDPDLIEILKQMDIGSAIPVPAFAAVASILAVLYRANAEQDPAAGRETNE